MAVRQYTAIVAFAITLISCSSGGDSGGTPTFTVTGSAGTGGSISPTSATVNQGASTDFIINPETGYAIESVTGCNGILDGDTYTTGSVTANCTVTASFVLVLSDVSAHFSTAGVNWNDYVQGGTISSATDAACNPAAGTACLHAGEIRTVATQLTSCNGLTATDTLGAFDWMCDDSSGTARFVSTGLAEGKHLSDLLDFAAPGWLPNAVTVAVNGNPAGTTADAVWWTNPVAPAGDGTTALATEQTIYIVSSTTSLVSGYSIEASKVGLVGAASAVIYGPGSSTNVITANGMDFLWLEGRMDATADLNGFYLTDVRFSRLNNILVENAGDSGIYLTSASNNNILSGVVASNNNNYGIVLEGASNNTLLRVTVANNEDSGIVLSSASNNALSRVTVANNGDSGIVLSSASNSSISSVTAPNNGFYGIYLYNASNNVFSSITAPNSGVYGIYLSNASNNVLSSVTAPNSGLYGIYLSNASNNNFSSVTASNNDYGIYLSNASNNTFTGIFQVGNNTIDCYVNLGTNPGLDDDSEPSDVETDTVHDGVCIQQGASDFGTAETTVDLANSFVGKVTIDDTTNASDTDGAADYPADPASFDWVSFDNPFRGWGKDVSAFPHLDQRGQWTTGAGRIWDWSVLSTDTWLWDRLTLPTGNHTHTHAWGGAPLTNDNAGCNAMIANSTWNATNNVCETTFLRSVAEILLDGIGNDNGLCESGETCLFTPNLASYQGHGALISAGTFTDGALTGITLMQYETNGR
jgi:parallel beta-helix repeat protein